jgi:hypothetical protein
MSDPTVINDPIMGLTIPTLPTQGPGAMADVSNSLLRVAQHDHTEGNGETLNLAAQDVDGPLSLEGNPLTNTQAIEFDNQPSQLVGSQDVNTLYVNQNVLGFNDYNGVFHPIAGGTANTANFTNFTMRNVSANFTILYTDTYNLININSSGGAVTGTLPIAGNPNLAPAGPTGRLYVFRDVGNSAGTHNITINVAPASGNTFGDNGATSWILTSNGGYFAVYSDGVSTWWAWNQIDFQGQTVQLNDSNFNMVSGNFVNNGVTGTLTNTAYTLNSNSSITAGTNSGFAIDTTSALTLNACTVTGTISNGVTAIAGTAQVQATVASAIESTIAGGITSAVFGGIVSGTPGGLQNNAGDGDWVSFSFDRNRSVFAPLQNASPLTNPVPNGAWLWVNNSTNTSSSGSLEIPLTQTQLPSGSNGPLDSTILQTFLGNYIIAPSGNAAYSAVIGGLNASQSFVLPTMHNGATLTSVTVLFYVPAQPNLSSPWMSGWLPPTATVYRTTLATGGSPTNYQYLSSTNWQPFNTRTIPTNSTGPSVWYQSGQIQSWNYTCNQNNVINSSAYSYYVALNDTSYTGGSNSAPGGSGPWAGPATGVPDVYIGFILNFGSIANMAFP